MADSDLGSVLCTVRSTIQASVGERVHLPRRVSLVAAALAISALAGLLAIQPASATNFFGATSGTGCTAGNMADPNPHTFFYSDLSSAMQEAQNGVRVFIYDPTDVNTSLLGSVSSDTDAVVYDLDYTTYCGYTWDDIPNVIGLTTCVSLAGGGRCQKFEIRYDNSDVNSSSSIGFRNAIACHETGHSLGLKHNSDPNSCVQGGWYVGAISSHDTSHLNANY